jgi:hypothetical protein
MKVRLVDTLLGLAISFAVAAFAQDKDTVDPEVRQQIEGLIEEHADAVNNNDTPAIAALTLKTRFRSGHGSRTVAWLPVSKLSRNGSQSS